MVTSHAARGGSGQSRRATFHPSRGVHQMRSQFVGRIIFGFLLLSGFACGPVDDGAGGPDAATTSTTVGTTTGSDPSVPLGRACGGTCKGTFCQSGGTSISRTCGDSALALPCLGTATGMYCTQTCAADDDCAPAAR